MKIKTTFLIIPLFILSYLLIMTTISWSNGELDKKFNDVVRYSKNGDYEKAYNIIDRLRSNLISAILIKNIKTPLEITKVDICKQLSRSGIEIKFNPSPRPGELICFLVELKNYTIIKHDQGGYLSHISLSGKLVNGSDEVILKFGPVIKFINNPIFNYKTLMVKYIKLPDKIKRGKYKIKFEIVDKLKKDKKIDGVIEFTIMKKGKNSLIIKI